MNSKQIFSLVFFSVLILWGLGFGQDLIQDGGFENQTTTDLAAPWWIDAADGLPPTGSTIEVEIGAVEAYEGNNNVKIVTTVVGQWIAIGQDLAVEENCTYLLTFYLKADKSICWDGNPEWAKGYMKVVDESGDALADMDAPHYYDGGEFGAPWTAGEIVFGGEDMTFWRSYHYLFNSGTNTEVYLKIGTYINDVVTWRVDGFKMVKLEEDNFVQDGGFENQTTTDISDPWWIDTSDGNPPPGSTMEVELGTGEAIEGNNNVKIVTTSSGQWIAFGQDFAVEPYTDYVFVFHMKGDSLYWEGNVNDVKGYMKIVDGNGFPLADLTVPLYCGRIDGAGNPQFPGEVIFGNELMMRYWRDYIYPFNTGSANEVYLFFGSYVNDAVTWKIDKCIGYKVVSSTGVEDDAHTGPAIFSLDQNYPNPFNPTTTIHFTLPKSEETHLAIYDILGRRVRTLIEGVTSHGVHEITWDGADDMGKVVPTGIYFYKLQAGTQSETKKLIFIQ
jgi:hypothetical protein